MMTPLIVAGLHKSYGTREVLRNVTGTFQPGRVTGIVGPNGAGKTTLLRILAGLQRGDGGRIVRPDLPAYFGGFDTMPVGGRVDQLFRALALPLGRDRRKLSSLSRGELQQQGLRIMFELAPRVLLLDEPWTALEPHVRAELNSRLFDFALRNENAVVICSSHDLDEIVRIAEDVVFLHDGVAQWSTKESRGGRRATRDELLELFPQHRGREVFS